MMGGAPGMMMGGPSGILPRGDGMMMAGPSGPTSMYYPPGHPMAVAAGVERRPEQIEQEVRRAHGPSPTLPRRRPRAVSPSALSPLWRT